MSAEEIAFLAAGGLDDDDTPLPDEGDTQPEQQPAKTAAPADELDAGGDELDDELDADPADEGPADEPPAPAATTQPEPPTAPPAPELPQYQVNLPADTTERIKALRAEERAAFARLMDADIEPEEYGAIRDRTDEAIDALRTTAITAAVFQEANAQAEFARVAAEWRAAEAANLAIFKAQGIDYTAKPALMTAWRAEIRALAALPENDAKDSSWFQTEAHRRTVEAYGLTPAAAARAQQPQQRQPTRGVDRSTLPPTLAPAPRAADVTTGGDEFAHLSALSGIALEKAVARLDGAALERYLDL